MTLFFKKETKKNFQPESAGFGKTSGTVIFGNYRKSYIPGPQPGSVGDSLGQKKAAKADNANVPSTKDLLMRRLAE